MQDAPPKPERSLEPFGFHPFAEPSFGFSGRWIFAVGDFSTNTVSLLQGFFINTGYYREDHETLGNLRGCMDFAVPFMRKCGSVYA